MIEQQSRDAIHRVHPMQFSHLLQFPALTHGVFSRLGGYSEMPYRGLNVAFSSGDDVEHVLRNRQLALASLRLETYPCATLWVVHGADVAVVGTEPWEWRFDQPPRSYSVEQRAMFAKSRPRWKADAIITQQPGIALALSFADCVPLLFYDPVQAAIGIAHAGWRGTARGIAAATVEAMCEQFGSRPGDIYAGIGPSIGPCCYEVSENVRQLFLGQMQFDETPTAERFRNLVRESAVFSIVGAQSPYPFGNAARPQLASGSSERKEVFIAPSDRESLRLDLWETNRKQLLMAGLIPEHIELPDICTSCNTQRFFSHRGEHGKTGRFPAILALRTRNEVA